MRRSLLAMTVAVVAVGLVPGVAEAAGREYSYVELAPLPGDRASLATDVNASGVVVGYSSGSDRTARRAVRWDGNSTPVDLGTLGGERSRANSVNDAGVVVGEAQEYSGLWRATRWDGPVPQDLGVLPEDNSSRAIAVNRAGVVVGASGNLEIGWRNAVRWDRNGQISRLAVPAGYRGVAADGITDGGIVWGRATPQDEIGTRAVLWAPDGAVRVLPTVLEGSVDTISDVNESGIAVGSSDGFAVRWNLDDTITSLGAPDDTSWSNGAAAVTENQNIAGTYIKSGGNISAVRWTPQGIPQVLATQAGGGNSSATDVDELGTSVGFQNLSPLVRAIVWDPAGNATTLPLSPAASGATKVYARQLTANGFIMGSITYPGVVTRGVLWR
ncbi:putative HAF family extracellular repeat protein [Actinokineospora baliensis]|uniref:hypothetical protein n=1 Tax=Actinokineospora baliensis TaxID=547056 RepID=UPI001957E1E6|nr:hypothetical protein [Actinokineospora baliensis]MBM7774094.1 putative HAF family extracellular repeat protein [Actinokineospora baliensis]